MNIVEKKPNFSALLHSRPVSLTKSPPTNPLPTHKEQKFHSSACLPERKGIVLWSHCRLACRHFNFILQSDLVRLNDGDCEYVERLTVVCVLDFKDTPLYSCKFLHFISFWYQKRGGLLSQHKVGSSKYCKILWGKILLWLMMLLCHR